MATANLRLTFGAMYIGNVISVSFSGIAALQTYLYFRQYRNRDRLRMKLLVLAVWILDLVHTIFICQGIWHYLVLSWGDLSELDHITWTVGFSIAITGFITILVQLFYAQRVWRLSKHNIWITGLIVGLAIVRLGSALTTTSQMLRLKHFTVFIDQFRWLFTFGLALSCIIDVIITGALIYYLRSSVTGYTSIDDTIHRIILYTMNNGLLTAVASLIDMICAASMPHNFLFLSLHFIIAKCYINSLLSTLNTRDALRAERAHSDEMAVHVNAGTASQPRLFRRQISHRQVGSREHKRSGSDGTTGMGGVGFHITPPGAAYDNVKVREKRDTFTSSFTLGGHADSYFGGYTKDTKKVFSSPTPPLSPSSTVFLSSQDSHTYPPSPPPALVAFPHTKVLVNVERTIHNDDGEIEADLEAAYGRQEDQSDKDSFADDQESTKDPKHSDFP